MNKIELFKNNKRVNIKNEEIIYMQNQLIIQKENLDTIISLDFYNKICELKLKKEDIVMQIPVLLMTYNIDNNRHIFDYTVLSEPEVLNTIIITMIE